MVARKTSIQRAWEFFHDNQMLIIPGVAFGLSALWVSTGIWQPWVIYAAVLILLPYLESTHAENEHYTQSIVDTLHEPLLILDATLRIHSANRAFYQMFNVSLGETKGRPIYELGNGQWNIPDLRTLLEDLVPKNLVVESFEIDHTFPVIGRRVLLLNACKVHGRRRGELLVLAMEDVTASKGTEVENGP